MQPSKREIKGFSTPLLAGLIGATALIRLLPTLKILPMNFNPIGGLAIFLGARLPSRLAYVVPVALMIGTNFILWAIGTGDEYSPIHVSQPAVYLSFLLYVWIGRALSNTNNPILVCTASLLGSSVFYLITNFQSWIELPLPQYTPDFAGLLNCYVAGIPFFQGTFIGDLVFTTGFMGLAAYLQYAERVRLEPRTY